MIKKSKITPEERDKIAFLLASKTSLRIIAKELGRSDSSISEEVKRNSRNGEYTAITAQELSEERNTASRRSNPLKNPTVGYKKFISAGGDGGSLVSLSLAQHHPDMPLGMHLTDVGYPDYTTDVKSLPPPEQEFAGFIQGCWAKEGAFIMLNASKPQSAAYAFNDSPVGLAAWIMSMMSSLSTGEDVEKRFGRDELLTNIMIYWVTNTIGSSMRISFMEAQSAYGKPPAEKSKVQLA